MAWYYDALQLCFCLVPYIEVKVGLFNVQSVIVKMAELSTKKQRSLGSTSSQSQQSKILSSVSGEALESKLTLKDLEELMDAFMVIAVDIINLICEFLSDGGENLATALSYFSFHVR